ncbi:MAG: YdbL family protein [Deltaproteobacteria bacterium]|nr:YdbL family protein [Candidatus Zymogenaceae bacterium]
MMRKVVPVLLTIMLLIGACVTVNIYFPAEAVRKAADEIVDDVYKKGTEPATDTKPEGHLAVPFTLAGLFVDTAWAQVDINISTPPIRAIRSSMEGRFPQLMPYYNGGNVGITNRGYLEVRNQGGLDVGAIGMMRGLVDADNGDRRRLYQEIASANGLGADTIAQIERLFADSWQNQAGPGWWIQRGDGSWVRR